MRRTLFSMIAGASVALIAVTAPMAASAQARPRAVVVPPQTEVNANVRELVAINRLNCNVDAARFIGRNAEDRTLYEVACVAAPGFLLLDTVPAQTINCIANNASVAARRAENPEGDPGAECTLERNLDVLGSIAPMVTAAGITCQADGARWVGMTTAATPETRYEIGCANADGYWIDVANDGSVSNLRPCLEVVAAGGACELTTPEEQAAGIVALAAPAGRSCQATGGRFVGANAGTGQRYYEVGCADGVGFMIRTSAENTFETVIECAAATGIAGGCTLSEGAAVAAASAEQLQSQLAAAGIACAYIDSGSPRRELTGDQRTVVEFSCSDRPWGLVAFLPNASGSPEEIDCLTAQARIGGCSLTTKNMMIDNLNVLVRDRPSLSSCSVADFRMAGRLTAAQAGGENVAGDVVELLCEGGEGFVTVLRPDRTAFVQSQTCATSAERGGTRCELGA